MSQNLLTQLREYGAHHHETRQPVGIEDLEQLVDARVIPIKRRRMNGPALAVAVLAAVLLFVGGISLLMNEPEEGQPADTVVPTTITQVETSVVAGTWETFSTESGLPPGQPTLTVDIRGGVWALADNTVYRFDGVRWDHVADLPAGLQGGTWLGVTGDGQIATPAYRPADESSTLLLFDGTEWRDLGAEGLIPQGLGVTVNRAFANGDVLVAGLDEFTPVLVRIGSDGIESRIGDIAAQSAPSGPPIHWSLTIDVDGVMWAGGWSDITVFDGDTVEFLEPTVPVAEGTCCVSPLAEDHAGGMWVQNGTNLYRFDPVGWRLHTSSDSLPDVLFSTDHNQPQEWAIVPTPDGNVWLFHANGVGHHDGTSWSGYTTAQAEEAGIPTIRFGTSAAAVHGLDGSVWLISSSNGQLKLYRYAESSWEAVPSPSTPLRRSGGHISGMLTITPDGAAWVATQDGAVRFTPDH